MAKEKELVRENECNEMTDAQKEAIVYRSKLLNKYFENYSDMLREEAEFKRVNEEKLKKQEEKKARAKEVEEAYLHYEEVKRKAYSEISEAEQNWVELRNKFAQDYGGYHMTYTNNNGKTQISFGDVVFSNLIDTFMK